MGFGGQRTGKPLTLLLVGLEPVAKVTCCKDRAVAL